MSQWSNTLPNQDLLDWYIALILKERPDANVDTVSESVRKKVIGFTSQEPFFLRAVLENSTLSDGEKLGMYIGVHTDRDGGERYPMDYHMRLIKKTWELRAEGV